MGRHLGKDSVGAGVAAADRDLGDLEDLVVALVVTSFKSDRHGKSQTQRRSYDPIKEFMK